MKTSSFFCYYDYYAPFCLPQKPHFSTYSTNSIAECTTKPPTIPFRVKNAFAERDR